MSITTTTVIAGPVNVKFQVNLLRNAKAHCPYFLGTNPAEIAEHQGTFTAKWRRIENLTPVTSPLTELTGGLAFPTRTGVQPTVTDITATVQKFGNFIILNEEVDLVNFNGQTAKLSEVLGINAGQSLNRLQRDVMEDNSTAIAAGTATTATDIDGGFTISENQFVVNALQNEVASKFRPRTEGSRNIGTSPIRRAFWGICHVDTEEDIRSLAGFIPVQDYGSQTSTEEEEFGSLGGVRFISTSEGSIDLAGGFAGTGSATIDGRSQGAARVDLYNTLVYGQDAYGSLGFGVNHVRETYNAGDSLPAVMMIAHPKGSAGAADPLSEVATMGWKSWHTAVVLNSNWGRNVRHKVFRLQAAV